MNSIHFHPSRAVDLGTALGLTISQHGFMKGEHTSWRTHTSLTVHVFCTSGLLRLDIDRPMFSADLVPGEIYCIPPNLPYRLSAVQGDAAFVAICSGSSADLHEVDVKYADRTPFLRRVPVMPDNGFDGNIDTRPDDYVAGYTRVEVVARTDELRALILGVGERQCVPWHSHDDVVDTFFCMEGPMRVETRNPDSTTVLLPGQTCVASARQPHFVSGTSGNPCTFLILQGVGQYNYVPFETSLMGQPIQ